MGVCELLCPFISSKISSKFFWINLQSRWETTVTSIEWNAASIIHDMSSSNDLKRQEHEGFFNFMLLFFCKSVKTEHEQLLAPISCSKLNLNTSVPTSSKDEDSPALAILLLMTSCFTNVPNKLLIRKTNLNTPAAVAVADIFVLVIKGVRLGIFRRASSVPIKQPSIWAGVFWADKSWQPEQQQIQSKSKQTAREGHNKTPCQGCTVKVYYLAFYWLKRQGE